MYLKVKNLVLVEEHSWDGILTSTMFTLRATIHNTMQYTPAQSIFGRDSIIKRRHHIDWQTIKKQKQELVNKGNKRQDGN